MHPPQRRSHACRSGSWTTCFSRTLAGIALALLAVAAVMWLDAYRLPALQTVVVGHAAGMRLVAMFVALLMAAHGVKYLRADS